MSNFLMECASIYLPNWLFESFMNMAKERRLSVMYFIIRPWSCHSYLKKDVVSYNVTWVVTCENPAFHKIF